MQGQTHTNILTQKHTNFKTPQSCMDLSDIKVHTLLNLCRKVLTKSLYQEGRTCILIEVNKASTKWRSRDG